MKSFLKTALLFLLLTAGAFAVRTFVYEREIRTVKKITGTDFAPFSVESAIMYTYANKVACGKSIAGSDPRLAGVEGVALSRQMLLGSEYFLGYLWRLRCWIRGEKIENTAYEDNARFAPFASATLRLWASLVSGLIFLWLIWMRCPWLFALSGALLHVFSPAAIARYTGQDILRGEFALVFIVATLAFAFLALRRKSPWPTLAAGLSAFLALGFWDVSQFIFSFFIAYELGRFLAGAVVNDKRRTLFTVLYVFAVLSAVIFPYNREHALVYSALIMLLFPLLLSGFYFVRGASWRRRLIMLISTGIVFFAVRWGLIHCFASFYAENYGHLTELLKAKVMFGNVKPADPAKLSFMARVLWAPALHSATWGITRSLFPFTLYLCFALLALVLCVRRWRWSLFRGAGSSFFVYAGLIVFTVLFVFFVRFHVFAAVFMSLAFALLMRDIGRVVRNKCVWLLFLLPLCVIAIGFEAAKTRDNKRSYPKYYFKEAAELIRFLRAADISGRTVLSDLATSPLLRCYCDARIVVQPKFELAKVRGLYREYVNILFHGNEKQLDGFCQRHKVDFVVMSRGTCLTVRGVYSYGYMAGVRTVPMSSVGVMLERTSRKLKDFFILPVPDEYAALNKRFLIYAYISPERRRYCKMYSQLSDEYFKRGDLRMAGQLAKAAYYFDPLSGDAYMSYYNAFKALPEFSLDEYLKMLRSQKDN